MANWGCDWGIVMRKLLVLSLFLVGLMLALTTYPGLATRGTFETIVLDFRDDLAPAQIQEQVSAIAQQYSIDPRPNSIFSQQEHLYIAQGDAKILKQLRKSGLSQYTEAIEPNYIYHALLAPNDPDYSKQWNFRSINIEPAWDDTKGKGITVAVIDTGISLVPDLKDTAFVPGYDFVNDQVDAKDDNGHGTHVAGTIAQSTNNGYGVAGIAYEANLMPLKVLSASGGGTITDIAEAIRFAADQGADVINMSLGGGGASQVLEDAINYAYNKGVVLVGAAGNEGSNSASYPARYPHVISVSALDAAGEKAFYSNFGAGVDIAAPGGSLQDETSTGGILQNTIDPETGKPIFAAYQGTSMAAPHVAGVAALVKAAGIKDPESVFKVLQQAARPVKDDALNYFGAGHLDAGAAVKLALKGQITFRDFFQWLRDNGYLNPRFWIDGGVVALLPKIAMVLGSYLLAWFLRVYWPFSWNGFLAGGLVTGSTGLFFLRGVYLFDAPQWPFRVMGSSIAELGGAIQGSNVLNPLFASVLIPFLLVALLLGHSQWKWFAIGSSLGVAACLAVNAVTSPQVLWLGEGMGARIFLIVNALLCYGLAYLATKTEEQRV
ncbi:MAG: S8 family peptidase [Leptolyngbyaceae bacterium]|nr:S8 family peptidase [Leptolyngbyaceae bacterium]